MSETGGPDVLVQRLHSLAVQRRLTIKEMAQLCGLPKSSLEGYMRLKDAKRPGIDALISIANAMDVSIDWLVGRSDGRQVGEDERRRLVLAMFRLTIEVLRDIEEAQKGDTEPIVRSGKVGPRNIEDFAARLMLHFMVKEKLFSEVEFDSWRIADELLEQAHKEHRGPSS
ncbi:MAG TPA: helix-turn-helix domain-containing protein [Tabrizicola sp.]|nr:helix-turn-helix domain-containing protein [Tabrizicola sp.]